MNTSQNNHYSPLPSGLNTKTSGKKHPLLNTFLALGVVFSVLVLVLLVSVLVQKQSIQFNSKAFTDQSPSPTTSVVSPTTTNSPTKIPSGSEEAELDAIDIGTIEADLKDIQTDFQGL